MCGYNFWSVRSSGTHTLIFTANSTSVINFYHSIYIWERSFSSATLLLILLFHLFPLYHRAFVLSLVALSWPYLWNKETKCTSVIPFTVYLILFLLPIQCSLFAFIFELVCFFFVRLFYGIFAFTKPTKHFQCKRNEETIVFWHAKTLYTLCEHFQINQRTWVVKF